MESNRKGGGSVERATDVDDLNSIGARRAGSESERRAARHLEQRLNDLGDNVEVEPIRVKPNFALAHLIHAVLGIVASVIAVYVPAIGCLLAAAVTVSAFGDLTGSFALVRSLTPARASQNLAARENRDKPGLLVLVAHYDSPLGGLLMHPRLRRWPLALFVSLAVITFCSLVRLLGIDATFLTLIQFIPTVVLIALTPALAETAFASAEDDPVDNATGVAAALRLMESHSGRLQHFDLMVLLTGASAHFGLGMQAWMKRHRSDFDASSTAVIALDRLGGGDVAVAAKEGPVFAARMHPTLIQLARESDAETFTSRDASDAYIARVGGLPALRIGTIGAGVSEVDPGAVTRACDLTGDLLERVDQEIGHLLG
jgi:hypothetical protein